MQRKLLIELFSLFMDNKPEHTPASTLTPDQKLTKAIAGQELPLVRTLLNSTELKLSVNTKDPISGRTHLHEAANSTNKVIFKALIDEYKADKSIRDKEGYTPVDLLIHPHSFDASIVDFSEKMNLYAAYFVGQLNDNLSSKAMLGTKTKRLQIVPSTIDMLQYIDDHPQFDQIGFIVKRPNCTKEHLAFHSSPILFDRDSNVFVQLDSFGMSYLMPERTGATFIHSNICRQISVKGCLEDAVILPYFILTQFPDFFKFCQENAIKDPEMLQPYTDKMHKEMMSMGLTSLFSKLSKKDKAILEHLLDQNMVQKQKQVFEMNDVKPLTNIFRLTEWPVELSIFIERFDKLYPLRTPNKLGDQKNSLILKHLLEVGTKRNSGVDKETLSKHIIIDEKDKKHDKKYDIGGKNMEQRHNQWMQVHTHHTTIVHRIFTKKLDSAPTTLLDAKKSPQQQDEDKAKIVDNIAGFVGAFRK